MRNPLLAYVGRAEAYLKSIDANLLPVSCTIEVPRFDQDFQVATAHLIEYSIESLRAAIGVNVHLDYFEQTYAMLDAHRPEFIIRGDHPDAGDFSTHLNLERSNNVLVVEDTISGDSGIVESLQKVYEDLCSTSNNT